MAVFVCHAGGPVGVTNQIALKYHRSVIFLLFNLKKNLMSILNKNLTYGLMV